MAENTVSTPEKDSESVENANPKGFYFNQKACIGCRTCQIACKDKNDLEVGLLFRHVDTYEVGSYPLASVYHYSASCNHCKNPECVKVCPVGAMSINQEDGTVQHDDSTCIGCQYCVKACPYGVPQYDAALKISRKCDGCIELRNAGEQPACVASCVMRALEFGPIDELRAAHSDCVNEIKVLPSASQTTPSVVIDARSVAVGEMGRKLIV